MAKRLLGLLLVIISVFYLFLVLPILIIDVLNPESPYGDDVKPSYSALMVCGAMGLLFVFILVQGWRLFRKPKPVFIGGGYVEINQQITVRLTFLQYFRTVWSALLAKIPMLYSPIFGAGGLLLLPLTYFAGDPLHLQTFPMAHFIFGLVLFGALASSYFLLKRQYNSMPIVQTAVEYHIKNEALTVTALGYIHTYRWEVFQQFQELKAVFVLYETQSSIIILPKNSFKDKAAIDEFRLFLATVE